MKAMKDRLFQNKTQTLNMNVFMVLMWQSRSVLVLGHVISEAVKLASEDKCTA